MVEGLHFLLRFTQSNRRVEGLGNRFSFNLSCEPEVRPMTGIVWFGAVAGRLTALAGSGSDGTTPKIAKIADLAEQFCFLCFQARETMRHWRS